MAHAIFGRVFTIKTLIRIAFTALSLNSIGVAHSQSWSYHAPAQNYYQNGWMADDRK
jgi:hypothetical protein